MKQLLTILLVVLATSGKAQDTIKLPTHIAKQVAKDLISCDSLKAVHELTVEQLNLTEQKVVLKDSIIATHVEKDTLYEERIKNNESIIGLQKNYIGQLVKKNKKLKVKLLFTKITLSAVIGGLTYLYITK